VNVQGFDAIISIFSWFGPHSGLTGLYCIAGTCLEVEHSAMAVVVQRLVRAMFPVLSLVAIRMILSKQLLRRYMALNRPG